MTTDTSADRMAALKAAVSSVEKQFGAGSIMRMDSAEPYGNVPSIPTGIPALDEATGIGGIPRGRVTEVFGPESTGKTTICLQTVASAMRLGGECAFIDVEHALDMKFVEMLGVRRDKLLLSQPDYGEQALTILETLTNSHALDVIVVDSVAALTPKAEIEGEFGESPGIGLHARLMSESMRKLTAAIGKSPTCVIFTNQMRDVINISGWGGYGPKEDTTGGRALKFYASMRIQVNKIETMKSGDKAIGHKVKVKIVKNKVAIPFRECILENVWGKGFADVKGALLDLLVEKGILMQNAGWYKFLHSGEKLPVQGKENVQKLLDESPELRTRLEEMLKNPPQILMRPDAGQPQG